MSNNNRSVHDEIGSLMLGQMGVNDGTLSGGVGYDVFKQEKQYANYQKPASKSFTSNSPFSSSFSSPTTTSSIDSFFSTSSNNGASSAENSFTFDDFFECSDWLFGPIEETELFNSNFWNWASWFCAVMGLIIFPTIVDSTDVVTYGFGALIGFYSITIGYMFLRMIVSVITLAAIIAFYIVIGFSLIYLVALVLEMLG